MCSLLKLAFGSMLPEVTSLWNVPSESYCVNTLARVFGRPSRRTCKVKTRIWAILRGFSLQTLDNTPKLLCSNLIPEAWISEYFLTNS